jgi:hypothetical protein
LLPEGQFGGEEEREKGTHPEGRIMSHYFYFLLFFDNTGV